MDKSKEIIYLEPDEEITSIIDKLKSFKDIKSVFLVAPKNATITQSVVNLKILKKEAESLDLDIAFVTSDSIGKNLASQVGLPVYESIDAQKPLVNAPKEEPDLNETIEIDMTERESVKPPPGVQVNYYDPNLKEEVKPDANAAKPEPVTHSIAAPMTAAKYNEPKFSKPAKPKKWILKLAIALVILGVGLFAFFNLYPKATVALEVKSEAIEENIEMTVDSSVKTADSKNNIIPGEVLTNDRELSKDFTATGQKDVGEKASGTVTLSNGAGTVANVSAGSQVESKSGLIFITSADANVPAATASVDSEGNVVKNPGKTDVSVGAKESGDSYNIGPTTFSIINSPNLSGANSANFSGGSSKKVTIISQDDLDRAQTDLKKELSLMIKDELISQAQNKKLTLLSDAIEYSGEEFIPSESANTEINNYSAKIKITGKTIAFVEDDYKKNIIAALGDKIPKDKELVLSSDDEITQGSYSVDFNKGTLKIDGTIKTKLAPKIDYDALKESLRGKSLTAAENLLRQNPAFKSETITLNISWPKQMPKKTQNITINKTYQNQ